MPPLDKPKDRYDALWPGDQDVEREGGGQADAQAPHYDLEGARLRPASTARQSALAAASRGLHGPFRAAFRVVHHVVGHLCIK